MIGRRGALRALLLAPAAALSGCRLFGPDKSGGIGIPRRLRVVGGDVAMWIAGRGSQEATLRSRVRVVDADSGIDVSLLVPIDQCPALYASEVTGRPTQIQVFRLDRIGGYAMNRAGTDLARDVWTVQAVA